MDIDFMDVVFLLVWIFFLGKAIFGGRGRKRDPMDTPDSLPPEETGQEPPDSIPQQEDIPREDYDYKKLRERILTSWGEKEEKPSLPASDETPKEEPLRSAPISDTIENNKVEPALKRVHTSSALLEAQKKLLAKADTIRKQGADRRTAYTPICLEEEKHHQKRWTAADAKKWLVYDAVFGAPRCQRPWRPK